MSKVPVRNERLQLVTIYEIRKILGASFDLPKMLHEILNVFAIYLETRQGTISLVHESGELHLVGASGMSGEEFRHCRECMGKGITGQIFQSGMPTVIQDITKEPQFRHCHDCTGELENQGRRVAYIGVPIKAGREVLGVMGIVFLVGKDWLWDRHETTMRARGIVNLERTPEWEQQQNLLGGAMIVVAVVMVVAAFR